jgi:hypothetical protein
MHGEYQVKLPFQVAIHTAEVFPGHKARKILYQTTVAL